MITVRIAGQVAGGRAAREQTGDERSDFRLGGGDDQNAQAAAYFPSVFFRGTPRPDPSIIPDARNSRGVIICSIS